MATGNLFLGIARRKVGDVVLYRRNGQQVSRVRVRSIANPKSVGQALQRNYMAPISRFYSPLSDVLERSWEGLNRSRSQSAFMSANLRIAREDGFYIPKNAGFVPMSYQVSYGNLAPVTYAVTDAVMSVYLGGVVQSMTTVGQLSARFIASGYLPGDQVTIIIALAGDPYVYRPVYSRFILDPESTADINSVVPFGTVFVEGANFDLEGTDWTIAAGAVIISRNSGGVWRRSTQRMAVDPDVYMRYVGDDAYQRAIDSYRNGSSVNVSDVYLNGSTPSGESTPVPLDSAYGRATDNLMYFIINTKQLEPPTGFATLLLLVCRAFNDGLARSGVVRIGDEYLLSRTTKGPDPGVLDSSVVFDASQNPDLVRWLIAQGVDASLFEVVPETITAQLSDGSSATIVSLEVYGNYLVGIQDGSSERVYFTRSDSGQALTPDGGWVTAGTPAFQAVIYAANTGVTQPAVVAWIRAKGYVVNLPV